MIETLENFFSKELLYISLTAVLLNIFFSISLPIIYNYSPSSIKNHTAGLNKTAINLNQNLFSSSIYVIFIVALTLLLTSYLKKFMIESNYLAVLKLSSLSK